MKKPVTMADIAKICNVSIATVSYVLNNRENQRISEETRQKVLQIANLYMYRQNPYARSLAVGGNHNILFFYDESDFSIYNAEILRFLDLLAAYLRPFKYNIAVAPRGLIAKYNYVDAIITYRIDKGTFRAISGLNFVPVISVDCLIDDNLFFEVNNSFRQLDPEKGTYLSLPYGDEKTRELLKEAVDVRFIESFSSLHRLLKDADKPIICLNRELGNYLDSLGFPHSFVDLNSAKKLEAIAESLERSISREEVEFHKYMID